MASIINTIGATTTAAVDNIKVAAKNLSNFAIMQVVETITAISLFY